MLVLVAYSAGKGRVMHALDWDTRFFSSATVSSSSNISTAPHAHL